MKKLAFVSRHVPNAKQIELAKDQSFELVHVGDADAFTVTPEGLEDFDGVVVVHPAAALRLAPHMLVGVYNNVNRAAVGEPPLFETTELVVFDLRTI